MRLAAVTVMVLCAALLAAGCGGGGSAGSNSTAPVEGGGAAGGANGGAPKRATAPNAPAGSKVIACKESAAAVEDLRTTAVDCATADRIMRRWENHRSCTLVGGASRGSCALGSFRCQAVRTDHGAAVSCARPGGDVSFIAKPPRD